MIKKIIFSIAALLASFLVLYAIFSFINQGGFSVPIFITKPTPTFPPTPPPLPPEAFMASPSAYATDEAVLRIEEELGILEKDLDTVDLEELRLRPPVLDLKVEY